MKTILQGLIIATVALCSMLALAQPPEGADSSLAPWFQSLETKAGGPCCSIADCRNYAYRISGGHYEIDYNDEWLEVPEDAVLERYDNPTGRAVACVFAGRVLCFIKASEA